MCNAAQHIALFTIKPQYIVLPRGVPKIIIYGKTAIVKQILHIIHNKKRHNNLYILPIYRKTACVSRRILSGLHRFCRSFSAYTIFCVTYVARIYKFFPPVIIDNPYKMIYNVPEKQLAPPYAEEFLLYSLRRLP